MRDDFEYADDLAVDASADPVDSTDFEGGSGNNSPLNRNVKIGVVIAIALPFLFVVLVLSWSFLRGENDSIVTSSNFEFGRGTSTAPLRVDFQLQNLDGEAISLDSLAGKWVLIDFWASWCAPCRQEAPDLSAAYEAWRFRGVEFVGVAVETNDVPVRQFVEDAAIPYPVALYDGSLTAKFGVVALPEKFFISPTGEIQTIKLIGPSPRAQLDAILSELTGIDLTVQN